MGKQFPNKIKKEVLKFHVKTRKRMTCTKHQKSPKKTAPYLKGILNTYSGEFAIMKKMSAILKYGHINFHTNPVNEARTEFLYAQVEDRRKETKEKSDSNDNYKEADLFEESQANYIAIVRNVEMASGPEQPIMNELPGNIAKVKKIPSDGENVCESEIVCNKLDLIESEPRNVGLPYQNVPDYDSTVQLRDGEEVREVVETGESHRLSLQLQKVQDTDIESPLESVLEDLPTEVCEENEFLTQEIEHFGEDMGGNDHSIKCLKEGGYVEDDTDLVEQVSEVKCLDSIEETEEIEYQEREQTVENSLIELKKEVKNSPGLRMIAPEFKKLIKKLTKDFFGNLSLFNEKCHLQTYQKTLFNPFGFNFKPCEQCLNTFAVRHDGLSVMPSWIFYEIRRLLSFANVEIDPAHPIILRLARDGFYSDNNGLVYCCFCGEMVRNYLLLACNLDQLTAFLDRHCNGCVRRNNVPVDEYGSNFNLADAMADYSRSLPVVLPSGTLYLEQGERHHCMLARWIRNIGMLNIVPSGCAGMRPSSVASDRLPSPAGLPLNVVRPPTSIPARLPSLQDAETPQQPHGTQINEEETRQHIAESHAGEIHPELEEVEVSERMVDNTHADIERELPDICSIPVDTSAVVVEKARTFSCVAATGNLTTIGTVNQDCLTGAAAAVGVRVPERADIDARIESFHSSHFIQTPQEMALAGLFYTGTDDVVRCYMCGGCLSNWEQSDVPLLEHIRNYPECDFVWNIVIDMQMCDDPMMQAVLAAFADSIGGRKAQRNGYTREQVCEAVDRLIFNREKINCRSIMRKLR